MGNLTSIYVAHKSKEIRDNLGRKASERLEEMMEDLKVEQPRHYRGNTFRTKYFTYSR